MPGDDAQARKPGAPAAPPSNAPTFKSLDEVSRIILRLERSGVQAPDGLAEQIREHLKNQPQGADPGASVTWLDTLERQLIALREGLDAVSEELITRQAEVDPAALKQLLITDPQSAVRQELNQIKGTRFGQEKTEWKRRIDDNLGALRDKHERQVMRLETDMQAQPDGRHRVTPTTVWWDAYVRWQKNSADLLRTHLCQLMNARWQRFVDREIRNATAALEASFEVSLPEVDPGAVRDFTEIKLASDAVHYRESTPPAGTIALPEEFVDPRTVAQKAASRIDRKTAMVRSAVGPMVAMGSLLSHSMSIKVAGMAVGLGISGVSFLVANASGKKEEAAALPELRQKAEEALRKRLNEDFRRRLERYRSEIERVQRDYSAEVQAALFDRLQSFVDAEMKRRNEQVMPEQRKAIALRQREIKDRLEMIGQVTRLLGATVLIDLEMRRGVLSEQRARHAA